MSDDPLHRFATRVVELQQREADKLTVTEGEMNAVALDLGMSEAELIRLKEQASSAKHAAKTLRMAGSIDAAIDVLETANAFHPLDVEVSYALADALFARSQKAAFALAKRQGEWQRAKALATSVVEIAPAHIDAAVLLKAITNNEPVHAPSSNTPWGLVVGAVAAVGLAVVAVVALFFG